LAGGITFKVKDYIDFLRDYYSGNLLTVVTQKKQTKDQIKSSAIMASPIKKGLNKDWHYGLGLWIECDSSKFNCGDRVDRISSPGAYGAYPFVSYEDNMFGIVAMQGALGAFREGYEIYDAVKNEVVDWVACVNLK
jgi:hypothetical protein